MFFPSPVGPKKALADFSWDERVWRLRVQWEECHFLHLQRFSYSDSYPIPLRDEAWPPYRDVTADDFIDTCNRSVGIYYHGGTLDEAFKPALFNYVYRRWYRPYRNDIEGHRFLAKFLRISGTVDDFDWLPRYSGSERDSRDRPAATSDDGVNNMQMVVHTVPARPEPPRAIIDTLVSRHRTLCQDVEEQRERYIQRVSEVAAAGEAAARKVVSATLPVDCGGRHYVLCHRHHILQPLFRALMILASPAFYTNQNSQAIGKMPVFLIRTGVEEGLSAPVTFNSLGDKIDASSPSYSSKDGNTIRVTLEAAIDFVLSLEARETAAYGTRPDPATIIREYPVYISIFDEATQDYVDKPVEGPSREWVDLDKHPDWISAATNEETSFPERWMKDQERQGFRRDERRMKGHPRIPGPGDVLPPVRETKTEIE